MSSAGIQHPPPIPDVDLETSWRAAKDDSNRLAELWQEHGSNLLKLTSRIADPSDLDHLLDIALKTEPNASQYALEQSARAGNIAVFQHMLARMPDAYLGKDLRLGAVHGGVKIWRALLAHNHACINWDLGHHGDALGQAVLKRDVELVRYLLSEGIDVRESNFVGMPVLPAARAMNASNQIVDLLEAYGAPEQLV